MTNALHKYEIIIMINVMVDLLTKLFEAYPFSLTPRCRVVGVKLPTGRASQKLELATSFICCFIYWTGNM